MHIVQGQSTSCHLTQNDYNDSIALNQIYEDTNEHDLVILRLYLEVFQWEPKKKYDLWQRPIRENQNIQTWNKKVSFVDKRVIVNELEKRTK